MSNLKSISINDVNDYINYYKEYKKEIKEIDLEKFQQSEHDMEDICKTLTADYPDDSHNFKHHIDVRNLAIQIFNNSNSKLNNVERFRCTVLLSVSSQLHDVIDHKYQKNIDLKRKIILNYLTKVYPEYCPYILWIIDNISFSKEVKNGIPFTTDDVLSLALQCVTDADRFYAIGLVGIERCIQCTIMMLNEKEIKITSEIVINNVVKHCNEKLLILRDKFRLEYTKNISLEEHNLIEEFVKLHK
jgi:HD superfamily phosphodiesterase